MRLRWRSPWRAGLRLALAIGGASGCSPSGTADGVGCPTGGGKVQATFSDIVGANTAGDTFNASFVTSSSQGGDATIEGDSDDNTSCIGRRTVRLVIPEAPRTGATYPLSDEATGASGSAQAMAALVYVDDRDYGSTVGVRTWCSISGTATVTSFAGAVLDYTAEGSMSGVLAAQIDEDPTRGTFTLHVTGEASPYPSP